ncbi:cytosine deaminase [Saccharomonospora sp. CUA-673]|uniref:nucleoside deaminase n=1 Tax=Saccharomonospora sp. CUA-673 TaxID=1904969 RepID=UPI000963C9A2|nr:nucleoside deaminase [Saccharomonospora sp. CUA-673]OLT42453.1 cytosine deaminase [Saccharomonospora sp. CUA-673]
MSADPTALAALSEVMHRAVDACIAHVDAGGLPFVGVLVDHSGGVVSEFGTNQVAARHDPTAHAEIVAMRDALARRGSADLTGTTLLATGEPCGLCYRHALDHGITEIHVAVDRDQVAALGFDYRPSYAAHGITDERRAALLHPLRVPHGHRPFTRYLHRHLSPDPHNPDSQHPDSKGPVS